MKDSLNLVRESSIIVNYLSHVFISHQMKNSHNLATKRIDPLNPAKILSVNYTLYVHF